MSAKVKCCHDSALLASGGGIMNEGAASESLKISRLGGSSRV